MQVLLQVAVLWLVNAGQLIEVFHAGDDHYACYRIPALLSLPNHTLVAFAEGRRYSCGDHGYVDLVSKTSHDDGTTWGVLQLIHSESGKENVTIGNPAPVHLSSGELLLPFSRNNTQLFLTRSQDNGKSWSFPALIPTPSSWTWVASGPPGSLQLPSKRILIPLDHKEGGDSFSATLYSDDLGKTWSLSNDVKGGDETQAAFLGNVSFLSMRSATGGQRLMAKSLAESGDIEWSEPWSTITETECEASTLGLQNYSKGPILVMSSAFANSRANMTLHTSVDGRLWESQVQIYSGSSGYSSLTALEASDNVGILFEHDNYIGIYFGIIAV